MFTKFAPQNGRGATLQVAEAFHDGKKSRHRTVLYIGSGNTREELESLLEEGEAAINKLEASRRKLPLSSAAPPKKRRKKQLPKWLLKQLESQEEKKAGKDGKTLCHRSKKTNEREKREEREEREQKKAFREARTAEKIKEVLKARRLGLRKPSSISFSDPVEKERSLQSFGDVAGVVYDRLGYSSVIQGGYKGDQWNEILRACVLARVFDPRSKRGTVRFLNSGCCLDIPLERIYRMMDHLHGSIGRVKQAVMENTLEMFSQTADVLFFDVTTLYFESFEGDGFRETGFSKDNKVKETQVVLALAVNEEGHPLWYELFPGNTAETKTLAVCIKKLRKACSARKTVLVADRGMFSLNNFEFLEKSGVDYVVAARLKSLKKAQREKILTSGLNESWLRERENKKKAKAGETEKKEEGREETRFIELDGGAGRRMIAGWSESRARKDARDRQRKIDKLMKKIDDEQIPISRLISNSGTKKYIKIKGKSKAVLNKEKIREDERWDGFHGIVTSIQDQPAKRLLKRYRGLWRVEAAFRANKHDLKMRPIFHWKKRRIESHVAICFLAYSMSYILKSQLERAGLSWSIERIREVLKEDQHIILEDGKTGRRYKFFGRITPEIEAVYRAFHLKRASGLKPLP